MTLSVPRGRPENLFDIGPVLAASGGARASMPTGPWLRGRDGRLSPAGLGVLLDDVLGQAVLARRPEGLWSVTTELNVDVAGPLPADGQAVRASAAPALLGAPAGAGPAGRRGRPGPRGGQGCRGPLSRGGNDLGPVCRWGPGRGPQSAGP